MKPAHEPGHMLVVDDNRLNRLLLTHALEQNGHFEFGESFFVNYRHADLLPSP